MKRIAIILIFAVLVVFDGLATSLAVPLPVLAILLHLAIVGLVYCTVKAFTEPELKGRVALAIFCSFLCLTTPVLGCLVALFLMLNLDGRLPEKQIPIDYSVGNPLTANHRSPSRTVSPVGEPLVYAFVHAPSASSHHLAIPLLRHPLDRKAVTLLQILRGLGDARTRLFARSALSSSVENRESILDQLRRRTEQSPESCEAHLNLAQMLFATAESGVFGDLQGNRLYHEAGNHFSKAAKLDKTCAAALYGKGMALIREERLDDVPEWYGRLLAVPENADPDNLAARLESELFAASGNWERTRHAAGKIPNILPDARRFWKIGMNGQWFVKNY